MQQLQTIDADTLMSTPLPVTQFIVEGLLPEGLHILAGSPKIGKSWLALWICLRVSKGAPVWDLPTMRGTVLYLCFGVCGPVPQKPPIWTRQYRVPERGNAHRFGGASIASGYTPCRTRRGEAPAPPAPEGEKGAICRRRKQRLSRRG